MDQFSLLKNPDERFQWLMQRQNNVCKFTGQRFETRGERSPHGDHCHDSLNFRGFVLAAVNRYLGAAEYIMKLCNWDADELNIHLKAYLADPGIDIGLEPYPTDIGYETEEEAIAAYELSLKNAPNEIQNKLSQETI